VFMEVRTRESNSSHHLLVISRRTYDGQEATRPVVHFGHRDESVGRRSGITAYDGAFRFGMGNRN
jgi:hypothetical protein